MYKDNPDLGTSIDMFVPLICMYDDSKDMTLLWSKSFRLPNNKDGDWILTNINQLSMSPNGLKLVV